jgi:hypothetical protein
MHARGSFITLVLLTAAVALASPAPPAMGQEQRA